MRRPGPRNVAPTSEALLKVQTMPRVPWNTPFPLPWGCRFAPIKFLAPGFPSACSDTRRPVADYSAATPGRSIFTCLYHVVSRYCGINGGVPRLLADRLLRRRRHQACEPRDRGRSKSGEQNNTGFPKRRSFAPPAMLHRHLGPRGCREHDSSLTSTLVSVVSDTFGSK